MGIISYLFYYKLRDNSRGIFKQVFIVQWIEQASPKG